MKCEVCEGIFEPYDASKWDGVRKFCSYRCYQTAVGGDLAARLPDAAPVAPTTTHASLERVLRSAYDQAASGKGKERHALPDERFEDQQICQLQRWIGPSPVGGALFQVAKKAIEAGRLSPERAIHELRGSVIYAAAAILVLEEEVARG